MAIKLSEYGKANVAGMSKAHGYVVLRESGDVELAETVKPSAATFKRIVAAHFSNPEDSRTLLNVEDLFASLALEMA